jgi:hypothetical protein
MDAAVRLLPDTVAHVSGCTSDAGLFDAIEGATGRSVLLHFDELGFLRDFSRWDEGFEDNAKSELPALKERIKDFKGLIAGMGKGQRLRSPRSRARAFRCM